MFDENILSKMNHMQITEELKNQQEVLDRYSNNPMALKIAGTTLPKAVADVYNENAQLFRRMADIYDNWATQLRVSGEITED